MRLGLVGPAPPPNGGMALQTEQLARLLREEGLEVELLPTNPPYRPAWIERWRGLRALFRLLPFLVDSWRLAGRVDVIHLMANSGWSWQLFAAPVVWLARWRKTPVVVNYRGGNAAEYLARSAPRVLPSLRRVGQLVVPSGFLRDIFASYGIDSIVVPNIIDTRRFRPAERRPDEAGPHLVVTRNLETIYGLDTAITALAIVRERYPAARLTLAGSGPCRDELAALAGELGLAEAVQFAGRLDREQVVELYRRADVMLNPARVDNMPNSLIEALACALPVVSTDVGGVPYLVEHGKTALLVPVDDAGAMAGAAVRLLGDAGLYRQLQQAGLEQVHSYTWESVGRQWLQLYRQQVGARA